MDGEGAFDGNVWNLVFGGAEVRDGLVYVVPPPRLHHLGAWRGEGCRVAVRGIEREAMTNAQVRHDSGYSHTGGGIEQSHLPRGRVGLSNDALWEGFDA
jgi:hypothetical protein